MNAALAWFDSNAIGAVLRRESRAAFVNRYFQVFAGVSLAGGMAAAIFTEDAGAVAFFVLQVALYLVSLFALLAGSVAPRPNATNGHSCSRSQSRGRSFLWQNFSRA